MSGKQRISYFPLEKMDAEMRAEMERCRREGTPRPESSAVRAHVPAAFWSFANSWRDLFHRGVCDHARLAAQVFLEEVHGPLPGEGRGCLVIARGGVVVEAVLRARVGEHFVAHVIGVERRLEGRYAGVELGCFIALTMGQQSWLRLLNIEHHQVLAGTAASMAPGYETPEALRDSKSSGDYWAKSRAAQKSGSTSG